MAEIMPLILQRQPLLVVTPACKSLLARSEIIAMAIKPVIIQQPLVEPTLVTVVSKMTIKNH